MTIITPNDNITTITVGDLRKKLKKLGFTVKTKTLSIGIVGSVHHIGSGLQLPSIFFSEDDRQMWIHAIECITKIRVVTDSTDKVSGPWSHLRD